MRDPRLAAILSLPIPGVGQLYNGRILAGILWLIITPGLWIGTGGLLGWVCHLIAAYTAYTYARDHRVRHSAPRGLKVVRSAIDLLWERARENPCPFYAMKPIPTKKRRADVWLEARQHQRWLHNHTLRVCCASAGAALGGGPVVCRKGPQGSFLILSSIR